MKILLCLLSIVAIHSVICEDAAVADVGNEQIQDGGDPVSSESGFNYLGGDSLPWVKVIPIDAVYKDYANVGGISYEDLTYADKKDAGSFEETGEQNVLYEVDYPLSNGYDTLLYEYNQLLNSNNDNNIVEVNEIVDENKEDDDHIDIMLMPIDYANALSNVPSDDQEEIMAFFEKLKSRMSKLKIVEIKRDSIVYVPSGYGLETLRQKMENTYYSNRNAYMEKNSSRGMLLFLGLVLMGLGGVFIVLLCKLKATHRRIRSYMSKMPPYEPMPNDEV